MHTYVTLPPRLPDSVSVRGRTRLLQLGDACSTLRTLLCCNLWARNVAAESQCEPGFSAGGCCRACDDTDAGGVVSSVAVDAGTISISVMDLPVIIPTDEASSTPASSSSEDDGGGSAGWVIAVVVVVVVVVAVIAGLGFALKTNAVQWMSAGDIEAAPLAAVVELEATEAGEDECGTPMSIHRRLSDGVEAAMSDAGLEGDAGPPAYPGPRMSGEYAEVCVLTLTLTLSLTF